MQTQQVRVHQKRAFYGIQHSVSGLYARIKADPPDNPQPSEESLGAVAAKHGHVRFDAWELATWFYTLDQAQTAFAHYIGAAPLEIVRREP